jgi:hypothetical protein
LLFQLAGTGTERFGVVSAPDSASAEDLLAEYFRHPGGEVGVLLPQSLVLLPEVGKVREQPDRAAVRRWSVPAMLSS